MNKIKKLNVINRIYTPITKIAEVQGKRELKLLYLLKILCNPLFIWSGLCQLKVKGEGPYVNAS